MQRIGIHQAIGDAMTPSSIARKYFLGAIAAELDRAYEKHGEEPWSRHEFYAILKEEVDELWDAIKHDGDTQSVLREAIQVAAMVLRYCETGDRLRGNHTYHAGG